MARANISKTKRGLDTRESIINETYQLLLEKNHTEITLDDISERVGIAKTSILWHFGSKNGLFLEVIDNIFKEFEDRLLNMQVDEKDVFEKLSIFLDNYVTLIEENHKTFALYFNLIFDRNIYDQFSERIRHMLDLWRQMIVKQLYFLPLGKANSIASCLIAFVDGIYVQYYIDPENSNLTDIVNTIKALMTNEVF